MRPPPQNPRASELWFRVRKGPRSDSWITFGNLIKAFFSLNEWLWRWLNCWFWIQWMEYRHYLGEQLRLGCSSAQLQARGGNPWIKTLRKLNCVASLFENLSPRQPSASSWCRRWSPPSLPPEISSWNEVAANMHRGKDLPHKSRRKTHGHFCRLVCLRWKNIPLFMCSFRCSLSLCIAHVVGWLVWINICHPYDKSTISNQLTTLSYVHLLKTYLANYYSTIKKQITITAIWGRLRKMFINTVRIPISEQLSSLTIHRDKRRGQKEMYNVPYGHTNVQFS